VAKPSMQVRAAHTGIRKKKRKLTEEKKRGISGTKVGSVGGREKLTTAAR